MSDAKGKKRGAGLGDHDVGGAEAAGDLHRILLDSAAPEGSGPQYPPDIDLMYITTL